MSKKQPTVALSTANPEYILQSTATLETILLGRLLTELKVIKD